MKDKIKKELEEIIITVVQETRSTAKELVECSELQANCASIEILIDLLLRLEE